MIKMCCQKCNKRIFDISKFPKEDIEINLKCSNCKNIVSVKCTKENVLKLKK